MKKVSGANAAVHENGWNMLIQNYSATTDLRAVKRADDPPELF